MSFLFSDSNALQKLGISCFDTGNVTNMEAMFRALKLERLVLGD